MYSSQTGGDEIHDPPHWRRARYGKYHLLFHPAVSKRNFGIIKKKKSGPGCGIRAKKGNLY